MNIKGAIVIKNPRFENVSLEEIRIEYEGTYEVSEIKDLVKTALEFSEPFMEKVALLHKKFMDLDLEINAKENEYDKAKSELASKKDVNKAMRYVNNVMSEVFNKKGDETVE